MPASRRRTRSIPFDAPGVRSARLDPVAHGAEAGIGVMPGVRARNSNELQIAAAAEAQPLHDSQTCGARRIPRLRENLVPWLADNAQRLRSGDADLPDIRDRCKH